MLQHHSPLSTSVTEFAKQTGDYTSLSAVDLHVIALAHTLEVEKNGTKNIKPAPKKVSLNV